MIIRVGVVLINRSTPVVVMSPECLWPLNGILSFPTSISGKWDLCENFNFVIVYDPNMSNTSMYHEDTHEQEQ